MSVVGTAAECVDSPGGTWGWDRQRFQRKFRVKVNSYADGPLVVLQAAGLPLIGDYYATLNESHPFAICREITSERWAPNLLVWKVTCSFETIEQGTRDIQQEQQSISERGPGDIAKLLVSGETWKIG